MALQITLNQTGKPAGVAGRAREDLDLGVPVVASASGGPFTEYRWLIVSKPVDVIANVKSGAGLSAPTSSTTQISPIDVPGTHLVELLVDAGFGLGARLEDVARITFYAGTALAADPRKLPRREPAFGERAEHNVPDALDAGGNPEGWAREKARDKALRDDLWLGRLWAGGTVVGGMSPSYQRQIGMDPGGLVWNAIDEWYELAFDASNQMPDGAYSVIVTSQGPHGANGFVTWRTDQLGTAGFVVAFCDDLGTGNKVPADFSFRVELGVDSVP